MILLPLIDLFSFGIGVGMCMLQSTWGARMAAPCATFTEAKASLATTENAMGWAKAFCVMNPTAGGGKGYKIMCTVTPLAGGAATQYSAPGGIPNQPPPDAANPDVPALNTMNSVYQYVVTAQYDIMPIFNFSSAPFLQGVPGLGKPVPTQFNTTANVEHPEGLNQ